MKVLIYGHSQAQPTGMGDDMVNALKKRKIEVKRLGLQGRNDKQLLQQSGQLGDVSGFDLVFLYCGGNNSNRADTLKLIEHFGPKRVVAILPPLNLDRVVPDMTTEQRIDKQKDYQAAVQTLAPTYRMEGGRAPDFKKDEIHLRSGTAVGKALVEKILTDLGVGVSGGSAPAGSPAGVSPAGLPTPGLALVVAGAAALLLALWFRSRR